MGIKKVEIRSFRNIDHTELNINKNLNIFFGENASGKTSILEALYLLSTGSSFRTNILQEIIQFNEDRLYVNGVSENVGEIPITLGVSIGRKDRIIRIGGKAVGSRAELVEYSPLQLVNPKSFMVIEGSPSFRRQLIDWGVFYIKSSFINKWKRYKRALNQRNHILKKGSLNEIEIWDLELAKYGTMVSQDREEYLMELKPYFITIAKEFFPLFKFDFEFYAGWDTRHKYIEILGKNKNKDTHYGFTQNGPHKADFKILVGNQAAKKFASRGQIKIIVIALKIAQLELLKKKSTRQALFLIDDICAELDKVNLNILKEVLKEIDLQYFLSLLNKSDLGNIENFDSSSFKLHNGLITQDS